MHTADLDHLIDFVRPGGVVVLTGAGISTDSGIPDYRGPTTSARPVRQPMTYQEFVGRPSARRRYWAGSHIGFGRVAAARPNPGHRALAALERRGFVDAVITQNVDGLHRAAGSRTVVDLHGRLDVVVCLRCATRRPRRELVRRLDDLNPGFRDRAVRAAADGDAHVSDRELAAFRAAPCPRCDGPLKPDVVFFGETVPRSRRARADRLVRGARGLLVLGSSLAVMSGYRLVLEARRHGVPVAVVNRGATRADAQATIRLEAALGEALPAVARRLAAA